MAPDSYETAPLLSTRINLYSKLVPAGRLIIVIQSGFNVVYLSAESAGACAVFLLPSCEMEPTILIVWPTEVVLFELKVTATVETGAAQPVADALGTALVDVVGIAGLLDVEGFGEVPLPVPAILMSAQVK